MKKIAQKTRIHFLVLVVISLNITSCSESFDTSFFEKEIESPSLALGLKIGHSEYTASALFEEIGDDLSVGRYDDNGKSLISFNYSQSINSDGNTDFVKVEDQTFTGDFNLLENTGLVGNVAYVTGVITDDKASKSFQENQTLDLEYELTAANFSEGTFKIALETTTEAQTEIEFTIPSLTRKSDGGSYNKRFVLNNNIGTDITEIEVDLIDYNFDFSYDIFNPSSLNLFNTIAIQLDAVITFEAGDNVSDDDKLSYTIGLNTPKAKTAYGDFKEASFNIENESFDLDFFNELGDGNISFENPTLKITATSGYGFPIGLTLESISSTDGITTNNLAITDASPNDDQIEPINGNTMNHYAIINGNTNNGETISSVITLNNENSNLKDLLNAKPSQFNLNVVAGANPNSPNNNSNFFDVDHTLGLDIDVELPLYVTFDGLTFNPNPFEFDAESVDELEENLNSLDLILLTRNSIPLSGEINLDFLDQNGNILFSKPASLMEGAPVDENGFSIYHLDENGALKQDSNIIDPTTTTVKLDTDNIKDLKNITHIQAAIEFNTTDVEAAKIQSTDKVRLDLSLVVDLSINGDDDNN